MHKPLKFMPSQPLTIGLELELQILDLENYDLHHRARHLLKQIKNTPHAGKIKPEITQCMVEINSSIHTNAAEMLAEIKQCQRFLAEQGNKLAITFCGGGTHPFQKWSDREIYPTTRYKNLFQQYGYLSKRFTVFGQHVHIGCPTGNDAIYLCHILARYIPQLIALSASSPYYQGVDTTYDSSRINVVNAFPLSGVMPFVTTWKQFKNYFKEMSQLGIANSMKDFYWDIRPKPEFGTVEVRVCDTPLTIERAVALAAYIQTLARYILLEKPFAVIPGIYTLYNYNRFQASRYGLNGKFINAYDKKHYSIQEDILMTLETIEEHTTALGNAIFMDQLHGIASTKHNDSTWLRTRKKQLSSLNELVKMQSELWMNCEKEELHR